MAAEGKMVTIFATMFCSILQGQAPACRLTAPPMIFETRAECQRSLERAYQKPMVDGRLVTFVTDSSIGWWQCASKQVAEWQGP